MFLALNMAARLWLLFANPFAQAPALYSEVLRFPHWIWGTAGFLGLALVWACQRGSAAHRRIGSICAMQHWLFFGMCCALSEWRNPAWFHCLLFSCAHAQVYALAKPVHVPTVPEKHTSDPSAVMAAGANG